MKISLCIPQYNRIQYLLKNLSVIAQQTYPDIEVVISDDASTDNTEEEIARMMSGYKYPIIYHRHPVNIGYDANLRKSLELATGDYKTGQVQAKRAAGLKIYAPDSALGSPALKDPELISGLISF